MSMTTMILGRAVSSMASSAARTTGKALKATGNAYMATSGALLKAADKTVGRAASAIGKKLDPATMVKYDKDGLPSGFNVKGKTAVAAIAGVGVGYHAIAEEEHQRLGSTDGKIYGPTPDYSVYKNGQTLSAPGGADGSLVFALDKTKNGGFL